jgi:hypothetical protein
VNGKQLAHLFFSSKQTHYKPYHRDYCNRRKRANEYNPQCLLFDFLPRIARFIIIVVHTSTSAKKPSRRHDTPTIQNYTRVTSCLRSLSHCSPSVIAMR